MAVYSLKSTNPNMSYIIRKRPGKAFWRGIRKGIGFGSYSNETDTIFNIWFKDANNPSYKKNFQDQADYLDISQYTSPLIITNILSEFFSSTIKKQSEYDIDGYSHTFHIPLIKINNIRYLKRIIPHMDVDISIIPVHGVKFFELEVTSHISMYHLLNSVTLLAILFSITADEYIDVSNIPTIRKYISSLNRINAPYFVRYLLKSYMLHGKKTFQQVKKELEGDKTISMVAGNTQRARQDFVSKQIRGDKNILDFGCGEGSYIHTLNQKLGQDIIYYAYDVNPDLRHIVNRVKAKHNYENVTVLDDQPTKEKIGHCDIILSEVIEHMSMQEAKSIIKYLLTFDFEKFIITTPNKEFNQFYLLSDNEYRHDDHEFELNGTEIKSFAEDLFGDHTYNLFGIGDSVNNISTTWAIVLIK